MLPGSIEMVLVLLGVALALGVGLCRVVARRERRVVASGEDVRWSEVYNATRPNRSDETGPARPYHDSRDLPDYYCLLGVPENASRAQIERRYRVLAAEMHPDRFFDDPARRSHTERQLRQLNEAVAVLRDPARRRRYDAVRTPWPIHTRLVQTAGRGSDEAGSILERAV